MEELSKEAEALAKMPKEERAQKLRSVYDELTRGLIALGTDPEGKQRTLLGAFIVASALSDSRVTREEYAFARPYLEEVFDVDMRYWEFRAVSRILKRQTDTMRDAIRALADALGKVGAKAKDELVEICLISCMIDGDLTEKEAEWLESLNG